MMLLLTNNYSSSHGVQAKEAGAAKLRRLRFSIFMQ
jgi:hypothetical protein